MNISQWKTRVKERDDYTCRAHLCGETGNLHVHHIKPQSKYPDFATEIDNSITLCGNCHVRLKGKEESTNLKTIICDRQFTNQLKQLNDKFCRYLRGLLASDYRTRRTDAVFQLLNHLHVYPDSLDQFLPLIQDFIHLANRVSGIRTRWTILEFLRRSSSDLVSRLESVSETDALVYMERGRDYLRTHDYDRAIAEFDEAIALNPNYDSYYIRGEAHYRKREYDLAITDFTIAIQFDPSCASVYRNRAAARYNRGEYDRAITDCTKAIELDSNYASAYHLRGKAYNEKGDSIRANADFDTVTQLQLSDE